MALISLIHPSRGRAQKSSETVKYWRDNSGLDHDQVELVVMTDFSDPTRHAYSFKYGVHCLFVKDNNSVVEATNAAARLCTGDILIYLSDDFKCPSNWGPLVLKEFEGEERPLLLKVDDCLQPMYQRVLTIPMMNRALYNKLGYFWHPEYKSMFVDCQLFEVASRLGAIKMCPHLKFPHEHVSIGKAPDDETYRRSAANWEQGKALFAKHKAQGFPI